MTVHALWAINKAGGLVFSRYYSSTLPPLPLNDLLILAGTLHGIHAITARLDPAPPPGAPPAGLQSFEAEGWGGTVFLTATATHGFTSAGCTKFVLLHSIGHPGVDELMKKVYDIFMKNPFHTPEMPINSTLFESRLASLMAQVNEQPTR